MKVAVLKERKKGENRVALSPEVVAKMIAIYGVEVVIEAGAGVAAHFSDELYEKAGAKLLKTTASVLKDADVMVCVSPPVEQLTKAHKVYEAVPEKAIVLGMMNPFENYAAIQGFAEKKLTVFAMEMIPRISRAQSMDVLSSQTNVVGYKAMLDGMASLQKIVPMMMTAAGKITPANVLVLGVGVSGLQAIATAKRMGAVVSAFDVRSAVKEQVESLGAKFVEVESDEDGEASGGYAKEMSEEYKQKQAELIAKTVMESDVVLTTALIPGRPAPRLVTQSMIAKMKAGSVIVDLAAANGGNVEGSVADEVVDIGGVTVVGHTNFASRVSNDASQLFARNVLSFFSLLIDKEKKQVAFDNEDEIIIGALLTQGGKVVNSTILERMKVDKK